jgi:glycosyltransferase involved in cell wall biosynthesis
MNDPSKPSIAAVIGAYQAERYIAETLESIIGQTHPPDEVIVVDDGSTDGTARELERFSDRIRVVRQANAGCAAAFNTAFRQARCDYVAECGADDIWEPNKLERQFRALTAHPEIDIVFSAARVFGNTDGCWGMPTGEDPSVGIMDAQRFARTMYRSNPVCPSTTLTRRSLYARLGPFAEREQMATEDYDYWMRALRAGAVFYYDAEMLVRYRRHEGNASSNHLAMSRCDLFVHERDADLVDRSLARRVLARDHFAIGRILRNQDRTGEARAEFLQSLRRRFTPRALAWALLLSVPERHHRVLADRSISIKRAVARGSAPSIWRRIGARARP